MKFIAAKWAKFNSATGFVSEGQGMGGASLEGSFGAILMSSLIGAFCGLICGLMLNHLARFLSMSFNRNLGGASWVIFATAMGAAIFAWMAIRGDSD
jgi:hypothetical protein